MRISRLDLRDKCIKRGKRWFKMQEIWDPRLNGNDFRLLMYLVVHRYVVDNTLSVSRRSMSDDLQQTPATISRKLAKLVKFGYLARLPDRRLMINPELAWTGNEISRASAILRFRELQAMKISHGGRRQTQATVHHLNTRLVGT